MCGRYSLALRPSQVRAYLEDANLPVAELPPDEGNHAPRQSYNFAPGYNGIVYRAQVPDRGNGPSSSFSTHNTSRSEPAQISHPSSEPQSLPPSSPAPNSTPPDPKQQPQTYELKTMKWGLIPSWTKRLPEYGSMLKTINCRDDSLATGRGLWNSIKGRKRCVVIAQGFYEWLKKNNGKEKIPHYVKRKDGGLMFMAGLWDCARYEGEEDKRYTYTVITTASNKQLGFLHDRMPCILSGEEVGLWLDAGRWTWNKELQGLLRPFQGELEVYPVRKEVGKVGNNSADFIVPVGSTENKSSIENFFAKGRKGNGASATPGMKTEDEETKIKKEPIKQESDEPSNIVYHEGSEDNAPLPVPKTESKQGIKRELDDGDVGKPAQKSAKTASASTPAKADSSPGGSMRKTRSATRKETAAAAGASKDDGWKIPQLYTRKRIRRMSDGMLHEEEVLCRRKYSSYG